MIADHGIRNPNDAKYIARHEALCTLEDVVRETSRLLKANGRCYFVHRPFRLVELFSEMRKNKIEPKRMRLVYPYVDKEPNMVLVEGVKGGKPRLKVEQPLIVYKDKNVYTDEIISIYRD
jgi:tRNA1(Val) A37 N6-methylase TrmN6